MVVLPAVRFTAAAPRVDMLVAMMMALVCGLGWVAATRRAPALEPGPPAPGLDEKLPPIPSVLPRPFPVPLGPAFALMLAATAIASAFLVGLRPDGAQGEALDEIQRAQPRVSTGTVVRVDGEEFTGVGKGKRSGGGYYFADLQVELADHTLLAVDRGIVGSSPEEGMHVQILHAPGRPELGGWVDDGEDLSSYLSPWYVPLNGGTLMPFAVLLLVACWAAAMVNSERVAEYGPRRLLTEDAAAGQVNAGYVERLTAVHDARTTVGGRAGSTKVVDRVRLSAMVDGVASVELCVHRADVLALATDFGETTGWLVWARRWTMVNGKSTVPAVFVAPDGRTFTCSVPRADIRRLTDAARGTQEATTPGTATRPWEGVCRTSPGIRLTAVGLYAAAGVSLLPALTGNAGHLTGYLPLALTPVAAILTAALVVPSWRRTLPLPGWERRTSRNARVRA
ncbi:hypothetical protein GCM10010377_73470 [Streptomyces viridiviolaceus]|uniref:DUF3592 domain-containing protein n=1 Tax=Streptomyces viridiviolaceus TaxID=68282 RepID=A0ABW2DYM5_9ACTN|nr:hypothetical protein [Streptomyces viridiviolaceus]GHB72179.1 hypothetical protein GCM10010377_73470 [Streptomyces viridiviolaceus]